MTDYTKLIEALRCKVGLTEEETKCEKCPYGTGYSDCDVERYCADAAAAIEELWADNDILHQHIEDMNEAFRDKSVECQKAAKRNAELHAELERWVSAAEKAGEPKRGEWIFDGKFMELHKFRCSNCKRTEFRMSDYCPNCGADMRKMEVQE